jgi:hypothetical protein
MGKQSAANRNSSGNNAYLSAASPAPSAKTEGPFLSSFEAKPRSDSPSTFRCYRSVALLCACVDRTFVNPNSSRRRRSNFFWKSRAGNHPHRSFKNFGTLRARVLLAKVPIALKRAVGLSGPSSSRQSAPILQQWSEQVCNLFVCNSIRGVAHNTVV